MAELAGKRKENNTRRRGYKSSLVVTTQLISENSHTTVISLSSRS